MRWDTYNAFVLSQDQTTKPKSQTRNLMEHLRYQVIHSMQISGMCMDSGASTHMTSQLGYLTDYQTFDIPEKVKLGDGRVVEAVGAGKM